MKTNRKISTLFLIFAFLAAALVAPALAGQTAPPAEKAADVAQAAAVNAQTQAQQLQQTQQEAVLKAQEDRRKRIEAEQYETEQIIKTYSLKYVNANDLMRAAKFYANEWTSSGNTVTVRIQRKFVSDFEAVLKKLDVEKKNIQFQVYTIVASKDAPPESFKANFVTDTRDVGNADLKRVLDEMKGLWNFKYYWIDNPSFLTVKDGSEGNSSKLVSILDFEMRLRNVELRGDEPGKRNIAVGGISLVQTVNTVRTSLIETSDITFKEKGYLVVGVSGLKFGPSSTALILVISAEVK